MTALRRQVLRNALEQFIANSNPEECEDLGADVLAEREEAVGLLAELDAQVSA